MREFTARYYGYYPQPGGRAESRTASCKAPAVIFSHPYPSQCEYLAVLVNLGHHIKLADTTAGLLGQPT